MFTSELDYELPEQAIAQTPAEPRDSARLLVALDSGAGPDDPVDPVVRHHAVSDLPGLLRAGDLLVVNDTRVIPGRIPIRRPGGGGGEVLLLEEGPDGSWEALCRPSRRLPEGTVVSSVGGNLELRLGRDLGDGRRLVTPSAAGESCWEAGLGADGKVPLPPYISTEPDDPERYQTVFSRRPGSVAAPTAGLHLTEDLMSALADAGIEIATVELMVGLDTFRPVSTERLEEHEIHSERFEVPEGTWDAVMRTRAGGGRVVAVGTTSVRALESRASGRGSRGRTDLFITPGHRFSVVDVLMTNFHLPRSSLLALLSAFVGDRWRDLYRTALAEGYRFLSFGDAMLVARQDLS